MIRQITTRRAAVTLATALLAVLTTLAVPAGGSAPKTEQDQRSGSAPARVEVTEARSIERQLGSEAAGFFFDRGSESMVVNVTDAAAAAEVREAGATPEVVDYSDAELARVIRALNKRVYVVGTAWGVDPVANTVLVSLDESVGARELTEVKAVTNRFPELVTIERTDGKFTTDISGGEAITGNGGRCSLGFNVTNGSTDFFLTAGHCTNSISNWFTAGGAFIGPRSAAVSPATTTGLSGTMVACLTRATSTSTRARRTSRVRRMPSSTSMSFAVVAPRAYTTASWRPSM